MKLISNLEALYKLIKMFEGCRLMPYRDPVGIWTCGWGSTGYGIVPGRPWTQKYADQRMERDATSFAVGTLKLCPWLRDDSLAAIADFAYNVGLNNLRASTLLRKLREQDIPAAKHELGRWIHAGGRVLPGLVRRRAAEAMLLGAN